MTLWRPIEHSTLSPTILKRFEISSRLPFHLAKAPTFSAVSSYHACIVRSFHISHMQAQKDLTPAILSPFGVSPFAVHLQWLNFEDIERCPSDLAMVVQVHQ